jgi:hypothetical protein
MMLYKTGNVAHDTTVAAADATRQSALAVATTQAAAHLADVAFHTAVVASGLANGVSVEASRTALRSLTTTQNA